MKTYFVEVTGTVVQRAESIEEAMEEVASKVEQGLAQYLDLEYEVVEER